MTRRVRRRARNARRLVDREAAREGRDVRLPLATSPGEVGSPNAVGQMWEPGGHGAGCLSPDVASPHEPVRAVPHYNSRGWWANPNPQPYHFTQARQTHVDRPSEGRVQVIGEADYRNVTSAVRPPRLAVFIDGQSPYWRTSVASVIRIFSQTWGGKYFLIVPTDGHSIADEFWKLLEAYSPGYLGIHQLRLGDLREADPNKFDAWVESRKRAWNFDLDFDEWLAEQEKHVPVNPFEVAADLQAQLKNRLAPVTYPELVIRQHLSSGGELDFPFTKIVDINQNAKRPLQRVIPSRRLDDLDLRALVYSQWGDLSESCLVELAAQGLITEAMHDDYREEDLADLALRSQVPKSWWSPEERLLRSNAPFHASMLHLTHYHKIDTHREWEEPVTTVVGDTVDDFCLYFCMSRIHDGVFWIPQKWLLQFERRRINNQQLRRRSRPIRRYPLNARVLSRLVFHMYRAVDFERANKRIEITSISLGADELKRSLRIMDRVNYGANGELKKRADIVVSETHPVTCIARVMEENNFANQQDMVFINGQSVGRLDTPKPKNFTVIDPATHRWMTSFEISEFFPPPLPALSDKVALTYEARVAHDGIAYLCPGVSYFGGGDIDVSLVRPKLAILAAQDVFESYFLEAGLRIQPSDKGNYLADTIDRFGGLQAAARFIADPASRAILELYTNTKTSSEESGLDYLQEEGRAFLSYRALQDCLGSRTGQVLDDLIGKDILRRGFTFLCKRCQLASWYDLGVVSSEFTCRRCGKRQQFTRSNWKMPEEARFYYALAETVYQCYGHNSFVTILALGKLRDRSQQAFEYLPEIDVLNFPEEGRKKEIDIACLLDGKIVLGECKTDALKPSYLQKYRILADRFARRPDELVFATTQESVGEPFRAASSGLRGGSFLVRADLLEVS
jgi:hypothetical protein